MPTPVSNATSYCTAAEFLKRYDARSVGTLVGDAGIKIDPTQLLTNAVLLAQLQQASGELESACLVGEKYNPESLAALTGNSAAYRDTIISDLCYARLRMRRGHKEDTPMPAFEIAQDALKRLRNGERIFGLQENMDAGKTDAQYVTEQQIQDRNLATFQASRYFGFRGNRGRQIG